jgi:hypothetical protein
MDMSNKSLALLLVAAIVISLGGTLISLNKLAQVGVGGITGQSVGGYVNLSITTTPSCRIDKNVSFGGAAQPVSSINISTDGDNSAILAGLNDCSNGTASCAGMEINNTGNTNLTVNMSSDKQGTTFSGDAGAAATWFAFHTENGTSAGAQPGCENGALTYMGWYNQNWTNMPTAGDPVTLCSHMYWGDANDMITVEFLVSLSAATPSGAKSATITIDCQQV